MRKLFLTICYLALILAIQSCRDKSHDNRKLPVQNKNNTQNSLASSPPMGWNSWNWFGKHDVNETVIYRVIDAMVSTGLRDAGYEYVVMDGGWRDTTLGPEGQLLTHPAKFPNGIKPLVDYAHERGLKLGLHTVPGTHDCIHDPVGGYGREEIHIRQFIDWGIDFIKLDKCHLESGWTDEKVREVYSNWNQLLNKMSDRPILLSISAYQFYDWYPSVGQMARSTGDISAKVAGMSGNLALFEGEIPKEQNKWGLSSVMTIAEENNKLAKFAGDGYWNDPDMLVVGDHGLTPAEQRSHFALWCIMSAPLMLGNDPGNMTPTEKEILLNRTAISVNQDPSEQGKKIKKIEDVEIWAKRLENGNVAILLLNRNQIENKQIVLDLTELQIPKNVNVRDIYSKKDIGNIEASRTFNIPARSSQFLLLSPTE